jgi:hypothetical protein
MAMSMEPPWGGHDHAIDDSPKIRIAVNGLADDESTL